MIEFAATLVAVGGAIAATVAAGTHYLDGYVRQGDIPSSQAKNEPLVRPLHPSGEDWPKTAA